MMNKNKKRKYWGWGYSDYELPQERLDKTLQLLQFGLGIKDFQLTEPRPAEKISINLPAFDIPGNIQPLCSSTTFDRLLHTYGQSFRDVWRSLHGRFERIPDYVAYPETESDMRELIQFSRENGNGLMIYGGGTSVTGGVELPGFSSRKGFITIDLSRMNKVLEINETDLTVKVQAGAAGPELEAELKKHGLVLRHYPQSFEFSTVGGWIATRAGGHYATIFTQIDHFVKDIRMITPSGIIQTRNLPNSGAGPNENRFFCGSEGIFGIITEATLKVQRIPEFRRSGTVLFSSWKDGVEACRQLSQSQLYPTNARLVDPIEAMANGLGDGSSTVLILGYESPVSAVDSQFEKALQICLDCGGKAREKASSERDEKADDWKKAFLNAPYLRDELIRRGLVVETFETCTSWSNFEEFHGKITKAVQAAIKEHCGAGMVTCRFTHLYPDGPAPYYTVIAKGEKGKQLEQWDAIKKAASETIIANGGTITHHHAVGRDHRPYFLKEQDKNYLKLLRIMKDHLDPEGLLNEGVLID